MPERSSKKPPKQTNQPAKQNEDGVPSDVKDGAVDGVAKDVAKDGKNPAAVALGRLGGIKGGKARAESMTAQERSDMARKAARARWAKSDGAAKESKDS